MHMNSAPHLLREDRPEFERVLDEALRTAHRRPDLAALGRRLNADQLRTMALSAATAIAACAEAEYQQFVRLREELRHSPATPDDPGDDPGPRTPPATGSGDVTEAGGGGPELREPGAGGGTSVGERLVGAMGGETLAEASGAGLVAMVSVLAPVLAATAAVIFLLLGYSLRLLSPEPAVAGPIRGVGWIFAALAAAGIVLALAGLLLMALRNGASSARRSSDGAGGAGGDPGGELAQEVALARAAWREALLEHGILPFLRDALADPDGAEQAPTAFVPRPSRLGYSHPGFSSRPASEAPAAGETPARPRFSSPDYSSPEYGGPGTPPA
ncbi:hypothetical protein MMF93_16375 [Streptomyces tubbatahanensis]|uniref:Transmembrane protein n=1 Tax=Streptomyces tubbatahanensis TaxID=2923272 RepID=A0ABY3XTR3_9ACTN|nr:hypothetical protein [Streptomyces tubbatahanensis]UNS97873.1 hypothetical protein MMF93_16375 [Streptomyces tubbatahanensis]